MIPCPFCKIEIDADSRFCDQCGEKLKFCPKCKTFGKKNFCTVCRTKLEEIAPCSDASKPNEEGKVAANIEQKTVRAASPEQPSSTPKKSILRFVNEAINANFVLQSGDLIGRRSGPHVHTFSTFGQVSGTHAKVEFMEGKGWFLTDLDSTNGTRYNNTYLQANMPQLIENKSYVKIANVEFYVQIEP